jgi:hypothetical protein
MPDAPGYLSAIFDLQPWCPSVAQVREAALAYMITATDWGLCDVMPEMRHYLPGQDTVERIALKVHDAVAQGRMIDFGHLPNEVIRYGGGRGGPLWQQYALEQPFSEPWLMVHSWDFPGREAERETGAYLVSSAPEGDAMEIIELRPCMLDGVRTLSIGDRGLFERFRDEAERKRSMEQTEWTIHTQPGSRAGVPMYDVHILPALYRFMPGEHGLRANNGGTPEGAAVGNIGDPVMTGLLMLGTRGIERETVQADAKLQRARAKNLKPPIPDYQRVLSAPYVTAIEMRGRRGERGPDQGGTHRSPVAHIRIGHPRDYRDGKRLWIADTLVNVPPEQRAAFKSSRSHYVVR